MKKLLFIVLGSFVSTIVFWAIVLTVPYFLNKPDTAKASVAITEGYMSTTTPGWDSTGPDRVLRKGPGMLGSLIVTVPNTGNLQLYDATTSDITKRAAYKSTSTILLVDFSLTSFAGVSPGTISGTYTYDLNFSDGLIYSGKSNNSTTTITWK